MQIFEGKILGQRELELQSLRGENLADLQDCKDPRVQRAHGDRMQNLVGK